jgi:hypothetical protein
MGQLSIGKSLLKKRIATSAGSFLMYSHPGSTVSGEMFCGIIQVYNSKPEYEFKKKSIFLIICAKIRGKYACVIEDIDTPR